MFKSFAEQWETPDAFYGLALPRLDVSVVVLRGTPKKCPENRLVANALAAAIDRAPSSAVFFQLMELEGYHSEVRLLFTEVVQARLSRVREVVICAENSIVKMGARVAGMVIPQLELVSEAEFGKRLRG